MSIPKYLSSSELLVIIISHGYKKFFVLQTFCTLENLLCQMKHNLAFSLSQQMLLAGASKWAFGLKLAYKNVVLVVFLF